MPSRETNVTRPLRLRSDGFGGNWGDKAMERMIRDVLRIEDEYYILAKSALADDRTHVLKHDDTFAVFDRYGDIQPLGLGEQGLYRGCTRFLSRLELRLWGKRPLLLGSLVKEDNSVLSVDLANPDIAVDGEVTVPRNSIHIFRRKLIRNGACHERLCLRNYSRREVTVHLSLHFEADFRDIFEVRGARRSRRGKHRKPDRKSPGVHFAYRGLDGRTRDTWIRTDPEPETRSPAEMHFAIRLRPKRESNVSVTVNCGLDGIRARPAPFPRAYAGTRHAFERFTAEGCSLVTSNDLFNEWIGRSFADLHMMISETGDGSYPHAGVPWFSTAFGRDGIIAAMQFLSVNPSLAKGVLSYLAKRQAR
jgi:glycogen debranching enzyme